MPLVLAFSALWLGYFLRQSISHSHSQQLRDFCTAYEAGLRMKETLGLLNEWRKVRPFLWVGQSAYSRSLVLSLMQDAQTIRDHRVRYRLEGIERWDEILRLLEQMLGQNPPPYGPQNFELLMELFS